MKRHFVLVLLFGLLLFTASSLVSHSDANGFSYKGFPFAYTKTTDTHGLCIGFTDETTADGGCGVRTFPIHYKDLASNFAIWMVFSTLLVFVLDKLRKRKS